MTRVFLVTGPLQTMGVELFANAAIDHGFMTPHIGQQILILSRPNMASAFWQTV